MKLLYCRDCRDVVRLFADMNYCRCGGARGRYLDSLNAVYSGESAVPLGFHNASLAAAVADQPDRPPGRRFEAFVIETGCRTFVKVESGLLAPGTPE